jgi:hypothetical protein
MWTTDKLGLAIWHDGGATWCFDARGGSFGIGAVAGGDDDSRRSLGSAELAEVRDRSGSERHVRGANGDIPGRFFSLAPVDEDDLPAADEQYVRGDRWCVNYPQGDGSYALRLAFKPIETTSDLVVLEVTISLQTDLLDTHPKIDIQSRCRSIDSFVPAESTGASAAETGGPTPVYVASSQDHHVGVLLGPHDGPFTTDHSTDSLLCLRLFGEFLEKGVIRKARPWIVIDRSGKSSQTQFEIWRNQLCCSPLPLTP